MKIFLSIILTLAFCLAETAQVKEKSPVWSHHKKPREYQGEAIPGEDYEIIQIREYIKVRGPDFKTGKTIEGWIWFEFYENGKIALGCTVRGTPGGDPVGTMGAGTDVLKIKSKWSWLKIRGSKKSKWRSGWVHGSHFK